MKTRDRITCQGTNDPFTWMQWLTSQIGQSDCSRPLLISIEYADTDDPGCEPKPNRRTPEPPKKSPCVALLWRFDTKEEAATFRRQLERFVGTCEMDNIFRRLS